MTAVVQLPAELIFAAQTAASLCPARGHRPETAPGIRVRDIIQRSLYVQYDPLNTVAPSHFLAIFARDPTLSYADVGRATSLANGVIEAWVRVACFMTVTDYAAFGPEFLRRRAGPLRYGERRRVGSDIERSASEVMRMVESDGPLTAKEIESLLGERRRTVSSWKTSIIRTILNYLWYRGYVAIVDRESGQPRFDTTQRAIGEHFDGVFDQIEHQKLLSLLVIRVLDSLVAATPAELAWFLSQPVGSIRSVLERLVKEAKIELVGVAGSNGSYYASKSGLAAIEDCRESIESMRHDSHIVPPFDTLIVHRDRFESLTGIRFRADLFTPADRRSEGAFYPLIVIERLRASRVVWLKSDRSCGTLRFVRTVPLHGKPSWSRGEIAAVRQLAQFLNLRPPSDDLNQLSK